MRIFLNLNRDSRFLLFFFFVSLGFFLAGSEKAFALCSITNAPTCGPATGNYYPNYPDPPSPTFLTSEACTAGVSLTASPVGVWDATTGSCCVMWGCGGGTCQAHGGPCGGGGGGGVGNPAHLAFSVHETSNPGNETTADGGSISIPINTVATLVYTAVGGSGGLENCIATGGFGWSGMKPVGGPFSVNTQTLPLGTHQFDIACWYVSGLTLKRTVYVTAVPLPPPSPTLTLTVKETASPTNTTSNGGVITIPNGTSATLSWTTTNATSCVATSPSGVNWNPTNATSSPGVSTGNLTTGSYVYSLRCNGSSGTVPITQTVSVNVGTSLADPTLSYVCNPAGNSVTLSWNAIPTAMHYALRVDDLTNSPSWSGTCSSVNVGDTCNDSVMTTTFTRPVTPNQDYDAWIHACPAVGSCSPGKHIAPTPFKCVPTPVTVSGRIYNQTTGIGYGAASGVKIAACGSNPGTVVNADGTYSFQVPVGPAFCIRLTDASGNPFVPAGASGLPKTVFTDPVRSWISSYEYQVGGQDCTTGSHCGDPVTSPDDGPSLWDRTVDTGYDFVYTSIPATVDLKANGGDSLTIQNNSPVTLTWSTSNVIAGSCSASGEWSGAKAENNASGESRGNLSTGAHTFVLTCREQGTNAPRSDTVQVTSINPPCTPNGCEANTCIPKTCNNGCGVLVPGTKDCREHWQEVAP